MTPEEKIERKIEILRMDLIFQGFAAAKQISLWRKQPSGEMPCPLCQQTLKFATAGNGHFRAKCSTENCISAME